MNEEPGHASADVSARRAAKTKVHSSHLPKKKHDFGAGPFGPAYRPGETPTSTHAESHQQPPAPLSGQYADFALLWTVHSPLHHWEKSYRGENPTQLHWNTSEVLLLRTKVLQLHWNTTEVIYTSEEGDHNSARSVWSYRTKKESRSC